MTEPRVLLAGSFAPAALERSYAAAFRDAGCQLCTTDIVAAIDRNCRAGRIGQLFNTFVPVEPWIRKANRELVLHAQDFQPDVLVIFGQNRVGAGALAQVRSMLPALRAVYVWPDTLVNLAETSIAALPLFDLVATYSQSTVAQFERLGARRVAWVPLAGDPRMHKLPVLSAVDQDLFGAEIVFVGQWRPERQTALDVVLRAFPDRGVKIWGPDWGRRAGGNASIQRAWQGRPLYEADLARAHAAADVSLNIIDGTNYPAANMRFFEIPMAGGLQVCSGCPEMETEFRDGETVFYYHSLDELPDLLRHLLDDSPRRKLVARAANDLVLGRHTYRHRVQQIMELLNVALA